MEQEGMKDMVTVQTSVLFCLFIGLAIGLAFGFPIGYFSVWISEREREKEERLITEWTLAQDMAELEARRRLYDQLVGES